MVDNSAEDMDALAREFHGTLVNHTRKLMRGAPEAEDIAQESWVKVSNGISNGGPIANIRGYLLKVARNLMIDHRRREALGVETWAPDDVVARIADPRPSAEKQLIVREELRRMDAIIAAMPARPRQVFRLSRFEGLSFAEIGRRLGVSRQTVHDHMTKALVAIQLAADTEFDDRA
ncbi:sigma-70 family RNA polymerase sigma factor [Novosphingobium sp.]|uniref:RNA polymerase sigma factor n=1 Tax=Novosphingobium sp. TaxID=1874826 RepID=UPI0028B055A6|nr:sigma-70 family RNA polymerase sigma factor [Novosphingobium sp.]